MLKELSKSIREFKAASIKAPVFVSLEVVLECMIPFVIARLVNEIKAGCGMEVIVKYGLALLVMAGLSLACGAAAGSFAATASSGFA